MIEVVEYMDGDYDEMVPLYGETDQIPELFEKGDARTIIVDGQVMACMGLVTGPDGVGTVWLYIDNRVPTQFPLVRFIYEFCKNMCRIVFHTHNLRRLQATTYLNNDRAVAFLKKLGFEQEGTMHNFGPDGEASGLFAMYGGIDG